MGAFETTEKPAEKQPLPQFSLAGLESPKQAEQQSAGASESTSNATLHALDRMLAVGKVEPPKTQKADLPADQIGQERPVKTLEYRENEFQPENKVEIHPKPGGELTSTDFEKVQKDLQTDLQTKYKDIWSLLPKESQETLLKLQEAVTGPDLKKLAEVANALKNDPEVAEKMAQLIEKNLREHGAKVHFESFEGKFILYKDGAKQALLIGTDGKPKAVTIEPNEPDGPAIIKTDGTVARSGQRLARGIAESIVRDIKYGPTVHSDIVPPVILYKNPPR